MLRPSATVELIWQDESGTQGTTTLSVPSSLTFGEIAVDAEALAAIIAPLTGCVLVGYRVKYRSVEEERGTASGSSPITSTGVLFFSTGPTTSDGGIVIHSFKPSKLVFIGPTANYGINLEDSDVVAFGEAVISSGITNPFGDVFTSLFAGYLQSRV